MRILISISLALFLWNTGLFALAIRNTFVRPKGMPRMMNILMCVAIAAVAFDVWQLYQIETVPCWLASTGLLVLALSQWIFLAARNAMRENPLSLAFSEDLPAFLIQEGPYRYLRHPFYTAYSLNWLAVVLLTAHVITASAFLVMMSFYVNAASQEERKFLQSKLAFDYRVYRQRTGMFLPCLKNHTPIS